MFVDGNSELLEVGKGNAG